jgi:hypothetical protein
MLYKQGQLLILEHGEYSDFGYGGPFRVLRDIDGNATIEAFKKAEGYDAGTGAFIAWLATAGYIEDVECAEWHLGLNHTGLWPFDYEPSAEALAEEALWRKRKARMKETMDSFKADAAKAKRAPATYSGPGYLDPV